MVSYILSVYYLLVDINWPFQRPSRKICFRELIKATRIEKVVPC